MARAHAKRPDRSCVAALLVIGAALWCAPAGAQTPEELAAARQVFTEGKQLEGKSAWAEALEKFKKVALVKITPQVRFHIALCEENLGHLVSALKGFELAAEEAKLAGAAAVEVANLAPGRADALRARVAKLHVNVEGPVLTSKIFLDDVELAPRDLGGPILVDPGKHVIEVRSQDGAGTFRTEVSFREGSSGQVTVPVHDKPPVAPPKIVEASPHPSRVPIYVAGGVGLAGLVVSGVFWGLRAGTISQAVDAGHCKLDYTGCDSTLKSKIDELAGRGRTDGVVSGVFLGVGIAGLLTAGAFAILPFVKRPAAGGSREGSLALVPAGSQLRLVGTF